MANYIGTQVRIEYGVETTLGTTVTATKIFGVGETLSTYSQKNNVEKIYGLGKSTAQAFVPKQYEGSWGVDFGIDRLQWLKDLFLTNNAGTVWNIDSSTSDTKSISIDITLQHGVSGNERAIEIGGAVPQTFSISAAVNDYVKGRINGIYQVETLVTTGLSDLGDWTESTETLQSQPLSFQTGEVYLAGGATPVGIVQAFEITGNTNAEGIWGLGSRTYQNGVYKQQDIDFSMDVILDFDDDLFSRVFAGDATSLTPSNTTWDDFEVALEFTNWDSGGTQELRFRLEDTKFEGNDTSIAVNEIIRMSITGVSKDLKMNTNFS